MNVNCFAVAYYSNKWICAAGLPYIIHSYFCLFRFCIILCMKSLLFSHYYRYYSVSFVSCFSRMALVCFFSIYMKFEFNSRYIYTYKQKNEKTNRGKLQCNVRWLFRTISCNIFVFLSPSSLWSVFDCCQLSLL